VTDFNEQVIDEFRSNGGKVGGPLAGQDLVLVTMTGARTGAVRTVPLGAYGDLDGTSVVFASAMGAPNHPQWHFNLLANPDVVVERGSTQYPATARLVEGAEREELWARVVEVKPFLAAHQAAAHPREVTLFRLEEMEDDDE